MDVIYINHPHQLELAPSSVAFGNFDGVHLGHQKVIMTAVEKAKQDNLKSGVMTFHPHPKEILSQDLGTNLTPLPVKLRVFKDLGLDFALIVHFTPSFSHLSPEQFIQQYIAGLSIKQVTTGFDFRFGSGGQGTVDTLQSWSKQSKAFELDIVPSINNNNQKISSSSIRSLLEEGDIQLVSSYLRRYYEISGTVEHGQKRGRTIGFPTANMNLNAPYVLPKQGVYAVLVQHQNKWVQGVLNIGTKPTVTEGQKQTIEVHLLHFNANLYGQELRVQFVSFIRDEQKFNSVEQLKEQISKDVQSAKSRLRVI